MTETILDASTTAHAVRLLLAADQQPILTISSNSMEPLLLVGKRVKLEAVSIAQLRRGDIITVVAADALYTHRFYDVLTGAEAPLLVTRGDQPLAFDPAWRDTQLLGRVVACEHARGWLSLQHGAGQRLNRVLTLIGRFENWLYGNITPTVANLATFESRLLGRWWRQDAIRLLLLRTMRGFWLRCSRLLLFLTLLRF